LKLQAKRLAGYGRSDIAIILKNKIRVIIWLKYHRAYEKMMEATRTARQKNSRRLSAAPENL
jgi:hypothetical protein